LAAIMSDDVNRAGKGFKSSAFLVAAVFAVLIAGWILKSEPSAAPERTTVPPPLLAPTLGASISPELAPPAQAPVDEEVWTEASTAEPAPAPLPPAVPPPADSVLKQLALRASSDAGRLARAKGRYTAQLLVACKTETVERLLGASGGSPKLYVLPAQVKDDACFRLCFGSYPTAKDAAAAADLPKALRGADRVAAVEIAKVLP
jgi:septal ring-binding cell division protein DamX